jgi:hypothetical protein
MASATPPQLEHEPRPGASLGTRSLADGELKNAVSLRDFLHGLGPLLQLPRRKRAKSTPEEQGEARPAFAISPPSRRAALVLLGLAATGAGAVHLLAAGGAAGSDLPPALQGRWVTSNKKYAGRAMEFRGDSVGIFTAPGVGQFYPVRQVKSRQQRDTTVVTLTYEQAAGKPTQLALRLVERHARLSLANQPDMIWSRER